MPPPYKVWFSISILVVGVFLVCHVIKQHQVNKGPQGKPPDYQVWWSNH